MFAPLLHSFERTSHTGLPHSWHGWGFQISECLPQQPEPRCSSQVCSRGDGQHWHLVMKSHICPELGIVTLSCDLKHQPQSALTVKLENVGRVAASTNQSHFD